MTFISVLNFKIISLPSPLLFYFPSLIRCPLTLHSFPFDFCFPRPGVLKNLKTMGSISLFIFFITLLVLARQVSFWSDSLNDFICRLLCHILSSHLLKSNLSYEPLLNHCHTFFADTCYSYDPLFVFVTERFPK